MAGERRKNPRLGLAIPVRVQGFLDQSETWEEQTCTTDVSSGGASFALSHSVELGQLLALNLALPKRLRQFDLGEPNYRIYTLVRGVRRQLEPPRVGVMFFGKLPPRGFEERPTARYLLPTDSIASAPVPLGLREGRPPDELAPPGADPEIDVPLDGEPSARAARPERVAALPPPSLLRAPAARYVPAETPGDRRSSPRFEVFVNFTIQLVDEWGAVLQEELTVADNVALGGARVMTSLGFQVGEVLLLREAGGEGFATRAEVRGITKVQPLVDRLHLRFLDNPTPQRLLRL